MANQIEFTIFIIDFQVIIKPRSNWLIVSKSVVVINEMAVKLIAEHFVNIITTTIIIIIIIIIITIITFYIKVIDFNAEGALIIITAFIIAISIVTLNIAIIKARFIIADTIIVITILSTIIMPYAFKFMKES